MKIHLVIPDVNESPTTRPETCPHCGHWRLHRHGTVTKPVTDHRIEQVQVERYQCADCARTFRHYPAGVTAQNQSQRTVVLATLLYGFGLSCSASALILSALGASLGRMSVWRDAQAVGAGLRRRRPAGSVAVIGADETVFRVRGHEVVVGFVVDAQQERTLGFEVLYHGDAPAFVAWLQHYAEAHGVEVLLSDGHAAYGVVAEELGIEHQLCLTHVRKAVANQIRRLTRHARDAWGESEHLAHLQRDLARIRTMLRELPPDGLDTLWPLYEQYRPNPPPRRRGSHASVGYRVRQLLLELIEHWPKLCLAQNRPALGLDGTNNVTERAIGKSKVRAKTMRGYKSVDGLLNGIALTQALYAGDDELNLVEAITA